MMDDAHGVHDYVYDERNADIKVSINGELKHRDEATVSVFEIAIDGDFDVRIALIIDIIVNAVRVVHHALTTHAPFLSGPVWLTQILAEDFARWIARQCFDEVD